MNDQIKCANICFFDAFPSTSGSGVVCWDFFQSIPFKKKKFFQFSEKTINKKNLANIKILKNKPFFKILSLPKLIYSINKYLHESKKKILIIEGPSWAFYSFVVIFFFRYFSKNLKIIYRSHSIECEIRKKNSNFLVYLLTFYFEKKIFNLAHVSTSVSNIERKKIFKYYNKKTILCPNCINLKKLKKLKQIKVKKLPKKFIFFCGSYKYLPNKKAVDIITDRILPKLKSKNIYLVLTGDSEKRFKDPFVLNLKLVSKAKLKYLYKKCIALVLPFKEGYGTKIKVLEALALNTSIVSTPKAVEGINVRKRDNIKIVKNINNFPDQIKSIKNNKKIFKFNYSMEKNSKYFFEKL